MAAPRSEGAAGERFEGFRAGQRAVALPAQVFTELLAEIEDPDELRVTLYALYAIGRPGKASLAMRASAIAAEAPMARLFSQRGGAGAVRAALDAGVLRGVLLSLPLEDGDALYMVNNDGGRRLQQRIAAGAEPAPGGGRPRPVEAPVRPSAPAAVYEAEIGTLTPAVAEALAAAEQRFPAAWIVDALRIASTRNARSWRYAEAILERWEAEGRDDEVTGGDPGRRPANPYDAVVRRGYD